jgi:selenocysteine lyase/cysteine desulfurase
LEEVNYMNSASIGVAASQVRAAARELDEQLGGRGTVGFDDEVENRAYEQPRASCARLIHAQPSQIAITTNATEALCQIAWWVRPGPGTNVVSLDAEFPSVTYPWLRVAEETGAEVRLARALDDPASISVEMVAELVDDNTSALAVSHVQYATGHRLDPVQLATLAHDHGALLILDASQSAGVLPIDVVTWDVDFLVATGYKWIGGIPGAALCYIKQELLEAFIPSFVGWRSVMDPPSFDARQIRLAAGARRMEFSTPAYPSGRALGAAVEYLDRLGVDQICSHSLRLAMRLSDGLEAIGAELVTPRDSSRRAGIVVARFQGLDSQRMWHELDQEGLIIAPRLGALRFSVHMFNDDQDVDRAVEHVRLVAEKLR